MVISYHCFGALGVAGIVILCKTFQQAHSDQSVFLLCLEKETTIVLRYVAKNHC